MTLAALARAIASWVMITSPLAAEPPSLEWQALPPLPAPGVAAAYAGVHRDRLILAGGSYFPEPVWENPKTWRAGILALPLDSPGAAWKEIGSLPRPLAHGMSVTIPEGLLCLGGCSGPAATNLSREVFLLHLGEDGALRQAALPSLPTPLADGGAAFIPPHVYVIGGRTGADLKSATREAWRLDWTQRDHPASFRWKILPPLPGPARAYPIVATAGGRVHVIGGRGMDADGSTCFYRDSYVHDPADPANPWKKLPDLPAPTAAGAATAAGPGHLVILSGDDGGLFNQTDRLRDAHPGFPRTAYLLNLATNIWTTAASPPANQAAAVAVPWRDRILLPGGEIRPRQRAREVWSILIR